MIYERIKEKEDMTLRILFNMYGKLFNISELSFNKKEELFYRPISKKEIIVNYSNAHTNEEFHGRLQHFSFHNDGSIHVKFKNKKELKRISIEKLDNNLFYNYDSEQFAIIMIDNISLDERNLFALVPINNITNNSQYHHHIWNVGNPDRLSLLIFLTHESKNELSLLNIEWINRLQYKYTAIEPIKIIGYNNFNLFILLSDKEVLPVDLNHEESDYRSFIIPGSTPLMGEHN